MVVVKIELWPHGLESKAREIGRAEIINDGTGTEEVGNYKIRLKHSGSWVKKEGYWKTGGLSGYKRKVQSPYHLVMLALGAIFLRGKEE